jgi:hypothetical protein
MMMRKGAPNLTQGGKRSATLCTARVEVEEDLNDMLFWTHQRWMNERTPKSLADFERVLFAVFERARHAHP